MLTINGSVVETILGDITTIKVDAIVNAANSSLLGGGGVDGAIHRAGGEAILNECRAIRQKQGGCKTGKAVITTAGNLPAKYVIHTVGPVWNGGNNNEEQPLLSAYLNSLELAVENKVESIAFPNISTGVYRFPKEQAAQIAFKTVTSFLETTDKIRKVIFVCFDNDSYQLYQKLITEKANRLI
ncbi:MAG: O-acetyl-ADP-ribose deacetylase [Prevotellaceae bacterium]|jgi:O-acetyl-ADP-ribose deacetylase (regulator of RNase III)|nr:O-acetyl-ADP-ribose deacetylase [Prevotellaceae bacterium]